MVGVITRKEGLGEPHRRPQETDEPILPPEGAPGPSLCLNGKEFLLSWRNLP